MNSPPNKLLKIAHPACEAWSCFAGILLLFCTTWALLPKANAQPGELDLSFNPSIAPVSNINGIIPGDDGTLFILGSFMRVDGRLRTGLAQLDDTGRITGFVVSSTFDLSISRAGDIWGVASSKNDTLLLWGGFLINSATERFEGFTRLTGSNLDSEFHHLKLRSLDPGQDGFVMAAQTLTNGDILIGGGFSHLNNVPRPNLARLRIDGTPDDDFNVKLGAGPNGLVTSLVVQPDGRILIAGNFTSFNGTPRIRVARLNPDGGIDPSFDPGKGPNDYVKVLKLQEDGKILMGGFFTADGGVTPNGIARLLQDGRRDDSFQPELGGSWPRVSAIETLPDGGILLGGMFESVNRVSQKGFAKLDYFGALAPSFLPRISGGPVNAISVQQDGKILVGGLFTNVNGFPRNGIARLQGERMAMPAFGSLLTPSPLFGGRIGLTLVGKPGVRYSIQSSADSISWQELTNFTALATNSHLVVPAPASSQAQFYRAQAN